MNEKTNEERIAILEEKLAKVRDEYNALKVASAKRNAREAKVGQVVRNLAALQDLFAALETRLVAAQAMLQEAAKGGTPASVFLETATALGKLAARSRRMASELQL